MNIRTELDVEEHLLEVELYHLRKGIVDAVHNADMVMYKKLKERAKEVNKKIEDVKYARHLGFISLDEYYSYLKYEAELSKKREIFLNNLKSKRSLLYGHIKNDGCDEESAMDGDWFYMDDVKDDLMYGKSYDGGIHVRKF